MALQDELCNLAAQGIGSSFALSAWDLSEGTAAAQVTDLNEDLGLARVELAYIGGDGSTDRIIAEMMKDPVSGMWGVIDRHR